MLYKHLTVEHSTHEFGPVPRWRTCQPSNANCKHVSLTLPSVHRDTCTDFGYLRNITPTLQIFAEYYGLQDKQITVVGQIKHTTRADKPFN